jgi:L-iditol 2-dehydrogenase
VSVESETLKTPLALPDTMQAARFYAPGDVRIEAIPVPTCEVGEVLIKVERALTCGTDLKAFRRGHPVLLGDVYPAPFGHECVGRIVAIGEGVSGWALGQRLVPANSVPCCVCKYCAKGQLSLCDQLHLLNGAYAEYLKVPASIVAGNLHVVDDAVPAEVAAYAEPVAVCLRGLDALTFTSGDRVAVLGTGPIACVMNALLRQLHPEVEITLFGRSPEALAFAARFSQVPSSEVFSSLSALSKAHAKAFDVVIEAIGLPEAWQTAFDLADKGGQALFFGGCPKGTTMTLDTHRLHYEEVRVISPFHHTPKHFSRAVALLQEGLLDPRPLISASHPLVELPEVFAQMDAGVLKKVAICP